MATSGEQLKPGTLLNGRYQISRPLGRGGMGTVFLAEHLQLQSTLAIKEVRSPGQSEQELQATLEQYQREARFLVQLNHPNLPKVTDAFVENDRFYLVMEYIDGVTLEARLKERAGRPLPVIQVIEWGLQITDVLSYLHHQDPPIIFRDLKPANVMVKPDNTVRLIDFGIARRFQEGAVHDTSLFGSVGYSPPEQFGRRQTDARSDIYAFGVTLHQMLTGTDPSIQPFKFAPVAAVNRAVPELLSRLIRQCLSMDPEERPADIHEVAMGLVAAREMVVSLEPEPQEETARETAPDSMAAPAALGSRPSGSSGPASLRIVSAKLSAAEAERKRAPGREPAPGGSARVAYVPPPSGRPKPGSGRIAVLICGLLLLAAALAGSAYVVSRPRAAVHRNTHPSSVDRAAPDPQQPQTGPRPPEPPASGLESGMVVAGFGAVNAVLVVQSDKSVALRVTVKGQVTGAHSRKVTLSGQFTDSSGAPLPSARPASAFSAGGMVAAPDIAVLEDTFQMPLDIPLAEFPPAALNGALKFTAALKIDGRILKEADPFTIPAALFLPVTSKAADPGAPGAGGAAQPGSDGSRSGKSGDSGLDFRSFHGSGQ